MRLRTLALLLAGLMVLQTGCAAGFRVGGDRFGAGAGAAIGPARPIVLSPGPVYESVPGPPVLR